jgi:tol-pal system protein YbgF
MTKLTPRRLVLVLVATGFVVIGGAQALAQTPLDDPLDDRSAKRLDRMEKVVRELRSIVFQGRETGQPVVVQPADTESQINSLNDKVSDLQQTLARLNGQLEIVRHDLDQSRQDALAAHGDIAALRDRVTALEQRLAALTAPPAPVASAADSLAPAPDADPAAAFAAARHALQAGDFATAEAGFRDFIDHNGDSPRAPQARYYLAKALIARRAWSDAATSDIDAIRGWPQTPWAPDAILDLSRSLAAIKKPADACQTLDELARRYPKASSEVKAGAAQVRAQAQCG